MYYHQMKAPIFERLFIVIDENSLMSIHFDKEEMLNEYDNVVENPEHNLIKQVERQLLEYFSGVRKEFTVPLTFNGTEFQVNVWKALTQINYGETKSYKDIADAIQNPKAVRAVGQANRRNKIPIIIPCHRVIGQNKALIGYAGSQTHFKEKLLKLEGIELV
ncbi:MULTISPECIES: methylated-DNA--[protein]-cysteine S-methyltransferase [Bacillus]|uniref:methylated-DNA--[protein]-cysteine S-methyltransferase n=1 Tax=Bacillus TaxID=1386 RepID=UPI000BB768D6|nr:MULTISPECIES: methylated-DNA--[protein]-cysteine S-methyltransferase [Bacillus]